MPSTIGSFAEFIPILDLLKEKYTLDNLTYHVIVPSYPGYTFSSGPPTDLNFRLEDMARVLDKLMAKLGFGSGYVVPNLSPSTRSSIALC